MGMVKMREHPTLPPSGRVATLLVDGVVYRLVPGCSFLFVSDHGDVYSTNPDKNDAGPASTVFNSSGYLISSKGRGKHDLGPNKSPIVHRMVAMAWVNTDRDFERSDVNHKDGNKLNNHASNLEWCSRRENLHHAMASGLHANPMKPVLAWKGDNSGWYFRSQSEAKQFGFTQANISKVLHKERPRANGFNWEFYER